MESIVSLIARLVTNRELCTRCLSLAADLDEESTQLAVEALATSVLVVQAMALCRWCKALKKTFRMPTE